MQQSVEQTQDKEAAPASSGFDVRNYHERAFLTLLRKNGPTPGNTVAKSLGVSAQTASVILRDLEQRGLVEKHAPIKGKVGKPSIPFGLRANGAFSIGMRLGRRHTDLTLMDMMGKPVWEAALQYPYPTPAQVESFVASSIDQIGTGEHGPYADRILGIGVAAPFELWNWLEGLGAPKESADLWRDYDFAAAFGRFTDLPVIVGNDVNYAATGELTFGIGQTLRNFAYFYLGAFVGGAVVLDGNVFHGARGNAGAFGSIPTGDITKPQHQLIAEASIYRLEQQLSRKTGTTINLRRDPAFWDTYRTDVTAWLETAAPALAKAIVTVAAVLDLSDIVIDGVFPEDVRQETVGLIEAALGKVDKQGLYPISLHEGSLGWSSGVLGAGYQPIVKRLFN